ncbi:Rhodopirellula transposase [Aureliella helgolandensis]|uniref:Rhodopirellula transposase n=2 Tax=Aureliella helgolandensis TaxID=2527968 RepID=A0A518G7U9_9BACT|nr:Rhodopirellula transposase [Aureliella helgolandensis]
MLQVCHNPLGTGKRNKTAHRILRHVHRKWCDVSLESPEFVVSLVNAMRTDEGGDVPG